ncbi:MAG: hypothetical protein AB7S38_12015 [Vulcanimicrobiota bacterium]
MRLLMVLLTCLWLSACGTPPTPEASPTPDPSMATPTPEVSASPEETPSSEASLPEDIGELEPALKRVYKDHAYCVTTRDVDGMLNFYTFPFDDDGEPQTRDQVKADLQELVDDMNELERKAESTLRFSFRDEIRGLAREGDHKVAVKGRFTLVARNPATGVRYERVQEGIDIWTNRDGKWKMCGSKEYVELSAGIVEGKPEVKVAPRQPSQPVSRPGLGNNHSYDPNRYQQMQQERIRQLNQYPAQHGFGR